MKAQIKKIKYKTAFILAVSFLLLVNIASALTGSFTDKTSVSRTTYQHPPSFQTYYAGEGRIDAYWPVLGDRETCEAREDILLQVAPGGCQPAVVRSDLLAEQNVPVFCQIDALSINPLVDVKEIKNIRFRADYPKDVAGAGFHPARAALRTRDKLLGDPLINNIGYVVLVLKKNEKENALPEFVNVSLSARIEYDSGNAFGIGRAEFVLQPMSDEEWELNKKQQSFWKGRYFIRLEQAEAQSAIISLYYGDKKINSVRVEKGRPSRVIYMPGFYCQAGLQIEYDGFVSNQKKARIEISDSKSSESLDIYIGSRFLNDKCVVNNIIPSSIDSGNVSISCTGGERFVLELRPRFDQLLAVLKDSNGKFVEPSEDKEGYYAVTLDENIYGIRGERILYKKEGSAWKPVSYSSLSQQERERQSRIADALQAYRSLSSQQRSEALKGEFVGDRVIAKPEGAETAFSDAVRSYENVADEYPAEKPKNHVSSREYGLQALDEAIQLAKEANAKAPKQQTLLRLLEKTVNVYPNSDDSEFYKEQLREFYSKDSTLSGTAVEIDNKLRTITLLSVSAPSATEVSSATLSFGAASPINVLLEENVSVRNAGNTIGVYLRRIIDENKVEVRVFCRPSSSGRASPQYEDKTLDVRNPAELVCSNSLIKLENVNLKEIAKVRLLPYAKGTKTETNLTVRVGIEKRAVQLAPDKTKDRISSINESIQKWQSISNNLNKVVTGLKAACFATTATLTAKNFISGIDGTSLARAQAMQGENGWTSRCKQMVDAGDKGYKTLTECFNGEKAEIDREVQVRKDIIQKTNNIIENYEKDIREGSFTSGYSVNTIEAQNKFVKFLKEESPYKDDDFVKSLKPSSNASEPLPYTYQDIRNWYSSRQLQDQGIDAGMLEKERIEKRVNSQSEALNRIISARNTGGIKQFSYTTQSTKREAETRFLAISSDGKKIDNFDLASDSAPLPQNARYAVSVDGIEKLIEGGTTKERHGYYLVVGTKPSGSNILAPDRIYNFEEKLEGGKNVISLKERSDLSPQQFMGENNIQQFKDAGGELSRNKIISRDQVVRYFETGPDKNKPAIVPFDVLNGWYARVKSNLNIGNEIPAYDASGLPKAWWICNVGGDGGIDSNDECQQVIAGINENQPVLSLDTRQSQRLVEQSRRALLDAQQYKGSAIIRINGQELYQGPPATQFDNVQCQDFMSPEDCKLLFNVCDPVICPATRCNFGGKYPVSDVIQTGIVGSALLCLPNIQEGIYVPVCLSGISAGIDAYVSMLKDHEKCLQENLNNGRMIGICDELYSIYACEFFWRQIAPVANVLLPKLVEFAYGQGQGARGGGEYLTVMGAWENTRKSIEYFTQTYAVNSLKAFQARSITEAGGQFCRGFVSVKSPQSFKSLIEPDSPPQFYAYFDSNKFSTATVPATAQYKVYYHIFAGRDAGVYYSVYLKNPPESSYYYNAPFITVASGFITKGGSADETRDFTAPEGYKELCVRINDDEECGFKQVSTDFAVNYLRDRYVADEIEKTDITSEKACISGSPSLGSLVTPSIQAGIEESALPQVYERGVVRICATRNPGLSTEPTRYVDAGYCGDQKTRCWLDKKSVDNAITDSNKGIRNETLSVLQERQRALLGGAGYVLSDIKANEALFDFDKKVSEFINDAQNFADGNAIKREADKITVQIDTVFGSDLEYLTLNHHKAQVLLMKSRIKRAVAEVYLSQAPSRQTAGSISSQQNTASPDDVAANQNTYSLNLGIHPVINGESVEFLYFGSSKTNIYLFNNKIFAKKQDGSYTDIGIIAPDNKIKITALSGAESIYGLTTANYMKAIDGKTLGELRQSTQKSSGGAQAEEGSLEFQ